MDLIDTIDCSQRRCPRHLARCVFFAAWLLLLAHPAHAADFTGLKPAIEALLAGNHIPGASVAVVSGDKIVWAEGIGVAEAGTNRPVTADTRFQAASISKPLAAVAALRLVQAGKLALDRPAAGYLSSVTIPGADKVTLRQLLSHTAATSVYGFRGYEVGRPVPTWAQVLAGQAPANSAPIVVAGEPGKKFSYSGGGYLIAQQMMMDASGQPFADLMTASVLKPLGMTNSVYAQDLPAAWEPLAAAGHDDKSQVIPGKHHVYPELAAAGLWTTASDLARFVIALQQAQAGAPNAILPPALAKDMLTAQPPAAYGLGLYMDDPHHAFYHGGHNAGFMNLLWATKAPNNAVIILTNSENGNKVFLAIEAKVNAALQKK